MRFRKTATFKLSTWMPVWTSHNEDDNEEMGAAVHGDNNLTSSEDAIAVTMRLNGDVHKAGLSRLPAT